MNTEKKNLIEPKDIIFFLILTIVVYCMTCFMPEKEVCTCTNKICTTYKYNFFGKSETKKIDILNDTFKIKMHSRNHRSHLGHYELSPVFRERYYSYKNAEKDYFALDNYKNYLQKNSLTGDFKLTRIYYRYIYIGSFILWFIFYIPLLFLPNIKKINAIQRLEKGEIFPAYFLPIIPALLDLAYRLYIVYFVN